ncbi:hypothetical protein R1sor_011005 [Riccia sorocarpa]|uniref:Fas-binding factor 1 C-terminal domain-containing protein n=1 Tax=Riccia sorocarpa TaxID=122646 RepID=A0ABD3I338_9MARC
MPISSAADFPPLTRPLTANATLGDQQARRLSQSRMNRGRVKSQGSVDSMFTSDPGTAPIMEPGEKKSDMGVDDFFFEPESLPSTSPSILKAGNTKVQTKPRRRTESLAALLGDQMLDANLKSLSSPPVEFLDKKPRQESQKKRVAFMDQNNRESDLELVKKNEETPLLSTSPFSLKKGENRDMHQAPDKDDEWEATDVLTMLPDGPDTFRGGEDGEEQFNMDDYFPKVKPSSDAKAEVDMSSEFGDYQPSFLSAPRRTPLAGRRRSPVKGGTNERMDTQLEAPPKSTSIKLLAKPSNAEIARLVEDHGDEISERAFQSSKMERTETAAVKGPPGFSRMALVASNTAGDEQSKPDLASPKAPIDFRNLAENINPGLDLERTSFTQEASVATAGLTKTREPAQKIAHFPLQPGRGESIDPQLALEDREQSRQLFLDNSKKSTDNNDTNQRRDHPADSRTDLSSGSNNQGFHDGIELRRPEQSRQHEEEWSRQQKAFCDMLLAERNALQLKLDTERERSFKERETLQAKLNEESLRSQGGMQLLSAAKEKVEAERDGLADGVKELREENLRLKAEVLRVENERLAFEKKIYEAENSHEDSLLHKIEEEKEEAHRLAIQLTSEVQLLKSSSLLAEEKIAHLYKLHEQEIQVMKSLHAQELDARDKHFDIERRFWSEHKTTVDTVTKLLEKGDEWAVKVAELHAALLSEKNHSASEKTVWLETMNQTVSKAQGALREWGDHCTGVKNQFDQMLTALDTCGKEIKTMHGEERERLGKEHSRLELLQEELQEERSQSLADLTTSRERLEEIRTQCFSEKENFLANCMQELKEIAAEKEAVAQVREQLLQAEAALEKHILEHTLAIQAEASEAAKQRLELERAKEMAAEIVQEVEDSRQELEQQRQAFEREIASVRLFGLQAQQKLEGAMEIQREALQLKLEAEAIQQESSRQASELERQKFQISVAQKELLELKRRHDEERMKLAMERQQLCYERKENGISRAYKDPAGTQVYSLYDSSKSRVFDLTSWDAMRKLSQSRKVAVVGPQAPHISSNSKSTFGSGPWVIESVEASLCLQAQEDFLAEASKVLQHATQNTCKFVTKT